MDPLVFFAVLGAAVCHATWNAVVKGGRDPFAIFTLTTTVTSLIGMAAAPFLPLPALEAWGWLALSSLIHGAYRLLLVRAYTAGDLGHVYPIARGSAPLLTAFGTTILMHETVSLSGYLGIVALSLGVGLMSFRGGRHGHLDAKAVTAALLTSIAIAAYTMVDGIGARASGSALGYVAWLFVLEGPTMWLMAWRLRGLSAFATIRRDWAKAIGGGSMTVLSYAIAIWAMTLAPIALIAALRETSVLFAALISVIVLKEPPSRARALAAFIIVAGVAMLRLG